MWERIVAATYLNSDHPEIGHPHSDSPLVLAAALLGRLPDGVDPDDGDTVPGHGCLTLGPTNNSSF